MAFVILHRADHVAFRIFEKDERADVGNMKLRHHNLSAIPGSAEYLVTTTKKVVGLALQKLPRPKGSGGKPAFPIMRFSE